jgi:hypothetical protein
MVGPRPEKSVAEKRFSLDRHYLSEQQAEMEFDNTAPLRWLSPYLLKKILHQDLSPLQFENR